MAVEVVLHAAPLRDGTALVATGLAMRSLRGAGAALARRPQPLRVAVLAPSEAVDPEALAEAPALLRRAAVAATLPIANDGVEEGGIALRSRRARWAVYVFGALLLVAAGESWAHVAAGLWLVALFPLFLRARGAAGARRAGAVADALGLAVAAPTVAVHRHAGLAALAGMLAHPEGGTDSAPGFGGRGYEGLGRACVQHGVPQLAPLYASLARGEQPMGIVALVVRAGQELPAGAAGAERADCVEQPELAQAAQAEPAQGDDLRTSSSASLMPIS